MTHRNSLIPQWPGLTREQFRYLEGLGIGGDPAEAVADATGTAATTAAAPGAQVSDAAITAVSTTAAISVAHYGYGQAQADAIPVAINSLITRQALLITLVNDLQEVVTTMQADAAANATVINDLTTSLNATLEALREAEVMEQS
jgi:hypothetical protein